MPVRDWGAKILLSPLKGVEIAQAKRHMPGSALLWLGSLSLAGLIVWAELSGFTTGKGLAILASLFLAVLGFRSMDTYRRLQTLGLVLLVISPLAGGDFAEATTTDSIMTLKGKLEAAMKRRYLDPKKTKKLDAPDRLSLLQDVIKGRRTEVDYLNGEAVKKGDEVGIPTPMNRAIIDLTKKIELVEVKPGPQNLEYLKPYLAI